MRPKSARHAAAIDAKVHQLHSELRGLQKTTGALTERVRSHADALDGAASMVELEAASLMKADYSMVAAEINRCRHSLEKKIGTKSNTDDVENAIKGEQRARRCAIKSVQQQIGGLKSKFDQSLQEALISLGRHLKTALQGFDLRLRAVDTNMKTLGQKIETLAEDRSRLSALQGRGESIPPKQNPHLEATVAAEESPESGEETTREQSSENENDNAALLRNIDNRFEEMMRLADERYEKVVQLMREREEAQEKLSERQDNIREMLNSMTESFAPISRIHDIEQKLEQCLQRKHNESPMKVATSDPSANELPAKQIKGVEQMLTTKLKKLW